MRRTQSDPWRTGRTYSPPVEDDRRPVIITPYDPEWPLLFETERELLEAVLDSWLAGGIHLWGSINTSALR